MILLSTKTRTQLGMLVRPSLVEINNVKQGRASDLSLMLVVTARFVNLLHKQSAPPTIIAMPLVVSWLLLGRQLGLHHASNTKIDGFIVSSCLVSPSLK